MKKIIYCILIFASACTDKKTEPSASKNKTLDFKKFTIDVPNHWTPVEVQGTDSYVRQIAVGQGDTLIFDYGYYSNSLREYDPTILPTSYLADMLKNERDTSGIIFTDHPEKVNIDKVKKQNVTFDSISGFEAKIVFPRKSGRGLTGVYFDSLGNDGGGIGRTRLNLIGNNLTKSNEQDLLNAIQTIKIKPVQTRK
jgi:hypothetical protein